MHTRTDMLVRTHASFRYTQLCVTMFTEEGSILLQNAISMKYFGMAGSENVLFVDVEEDGTPVNRLRALFGDDQATYDRMMDALDSDACDHHWADKIKVPMSNFKPFKKGEAAARESFRRLNMSMRGGLEVDSEEEEEEAFLWMLMQAHKFRDPSTGSFVINTEMKVKSHGDATRCVNQPRHCDRPTRTPTRAQSPA